MSQNHVRRSYMHAHRQSKSPQSSWKAKDPAIVPFASKNALREAMRLEQVPSSAYDDLLWIMAQESGGVVNVRNSSSTARGLYQLLRMQYELNPHGENSFGNAIEECQGGIHYILGRYHSAKAAKAFWETHHWY